MSYPVLSYPILSHRILSYVNNPILVLPDSVCCAVVPNQYQRSSLQYLGLRANKALISLWGKQQILMIIVSLLLSKPQYSLLQVNFAELPICWTLPFEISNLEYQLKSCVHIKGCVKIFIYCCVHKVYSDNRVRFIPHCLRFIPVCRLKLTATITSVFIMLIFYDSKWRYCRHWKTWWICLLTFVVD